MSVLHTLLARDRLLAGTALAFTVGFIAAALIAPFDTRLITGINPWIKPMKFMSSIAIFLATIAWFMPEMTRGSRRTLNRLRWTMVITMVIEIVCIAGQAARGTTSHFNDTSALNGAIFSIMGAAITVNTVAVAWLLMLLRRDSPPDRAGYLWGVRLGIAVFVIGSLLGFVLVANHGHSVPGPDGSPGLPFVNWSLDRGDLRVAHFFGLHGLQALPLLGFVLDRSAAAPTARRRVVTAVALAWLAVVGATLLQALAGRPLLAL
jgi:hypothetical protein